MKQLLIALALVACGAPPRPVAPAAENKFEMRSYTFVLLKRGPAWTAEKTPESTKLFEGHMANIEAMAKAGKLVLAGPFDAPADDPTAYAGLFLFDASSEDEVRALLAADPAIAAGRLVPELRSWHGPTGITYNGASQFAP
jgi:uncharacterized protein